MRENISKKELKLGLKDNKILFNLDFKARQTNSELAKKVGLSKQGVDYKINKLIENKVILGFYPIINLPLLGYKYGRIFLKLQNLTEEKEAQMLKELIQNPRINWILRSEGNYDILMACWTKDLKNLKEITQELLYKYGKFIKEKKESLGINVTHFQNRYLLGVKETEEISIGEQKESVKIDELDKKILIELCNGARIPIVKLAEKLNISAKVAAYRIKRLENNKVILGYRPLINNNLLGLMHYKILFYLTNVTHEGFNKFKAYLKNDPRVVYIVDEIGICDIDIELMLKSVHDLFKFIKEIKFRFPRLIREYETLVLVDTLKVNYLPTYE
jgi:Lrp/AsnC family leucine-responsive transcriptional regulator